MGDLALRWNLEQGAADFAIEDDDLATDEGLRTAVFLSLFLDRRANDDDVLPDGSGDRRGWWGDEFEEVEGDRIGSRRWLLDRSKNVPGLAGRLEDIDREALAWLLEDGVASSIDVVVTITSALLTEVITIHRPRGDDVEFKFAHTWEGEVDAV